MLVRPTAYGEIAKTMLSFHTKMSAVAKTGRACSEPFTVTGRSRVAEGPHGNRTMAERKSLFFNVLKFEIIADASKITVSNCKLLKIRKKRRSRVSW